MSLSKDDIEGIEALYGEKETFKLMTILYMFHKKKDAYTDSHIKERALMSFLSC